jgi:putative FmdB family regulatory protein
MPLYAYICHGCGHRFDLFRYLHQDDAEIECPECGEKSPLKTITSFNSAGCSSSSSYYS